MVSVEGVFIDPLRLVLKTKQTTENAKKLEIRLEESFGMVNLRENKGKGKNKGAIAAKTRKSDAKKFEQKKAKRTTLEKDLQTNMEMFVTRSVMDPDIHFSAPLEIPIAKVRCESPNSIVNHIRPQISAQASTHTANDNLMHCNTVQHKHEIIESVRPCSIEIEWPIPIKWPKHDYRSHRPINVDGQFDPDLILHYALERIQLPNYENTFRWLCIQPMVQEALIFLFWLCKVKFFQKDSTPLDEAFLINGVAQQYARIMFIRIYHIYSPMLCIMLSISYAQARVIFTRKDFERLYCCK